MTSRNEMPGTEAFDMAMAECKVAHETGFDCLGFANKYLAGPVHQFMSPLLMAAYAMARFPSMYVTTNVYLLPYDNPVKVAEEVATLDMMAPGKFLFGVGQGYRADEGRAFGIANNERGRRMAESIHAMRLLWQEAPATFKGEFWQFENADIGVKPVNRKGPPILVAADKARTIDLIFERGGDYWYPSARCSKTFLREHMPVYRGALDRARRPFRGLPLIRDICVSKDKASAEAMVKAAITDYLNRQSTWGQPGEDYSVGFDELKADRLILGSSEEAAEEIIALNREFGAGFVSFRIFHPGMDRQCALDVIRQMGDEVLPMVRKELGAGSIFD